MAVGRLDKDTEGLLLLTSRGAFSRGVTYGVGPERVRVEKEYFCLVDGAVDDCALERLREGPNKSILSKLSSSGTALSPASSSLALKKSAGVPVFMVCTSWGSPYMVYGPTGSPTALYFLDPQDAVQMGQEFLQLMPAGGGGNSVHVMATSMERALRHASGRDLPTGSIGEDGKVEVMEYRLVGGARDRRRARMEMGVEAGVPVFGVEGMTTGKGEAVLFFSYEDLVEAWRKGPGGGKGGDMPEVEVFDFVEVIKAMDGKDGEEFNVKFVGCKGGKEYKESITSTGNGKARLKPMR
ncbi:hypothetical protein TrRE_jg7378 [Triparma retinervis]|uniref:Pseudouridine synthase RsuA/RluA-like domain-containing protein n=1 Tax=Triparma retinervis TaxID=2557542 RepID=A0A9W7AD07_9STRA|nr:hypothetical protein TrRE_jg7378 [Triparma retinervis]